jgi:hypothetical protein
MRCLFERVKGGWSSLYHGVILNNMCDVPLQRKLKAKYDGKQLWSKGCTIEPDFD